MTIFVKYVIKYSGVVSKLSKLCIAEMNSIYSIFATEDGAERLLSPLAEETQALWKMSRVIWSCLKIL